MSNVIETLRVRGFVEQTTHDQELVEYLEQGAATCYVGFDPTGASPACRTPVAHNGLGPDATLWAPSHSLGRRGHGHGGRSKR